MKITSVWLISFAFFNACSAIPLSMFYPYGNPSHDNRLPPNDDGSSSEIHISSSFPFFNTSHRSLFVNTNGDLTFLSSLSSYTPSPFPYQQNSQIVAIYWGDIDTTNGGDVWYRETQDSVFLQKASTEIHSSFPRQSGFNASWAFVTTWSNVAFFGADTIGKRRRCTFQCVLVTDGEHSFVILNYYKVQWTTGTSNSGDASTGLGGTPAQVGFDAGDGIHYYAVPSSRTPDIINITHMSNVGIPGKYIFRVDLAFLEQSSLNECDGKVCLHDGTCQDSVGLSTWRCNCLSGFTGKLCETDVNKCRSSPCQHHGSCLNVPNDYQCHCMAGFTGHDCQAGQYQTQNSSLYK
ncbi:Sushi, nidogen and EGF-like domain-containing protein 1 [Mytilus edulis]|uniref:Sushi, nidogen and EGF-like domain-containing protein 1 n=1 Tax=Mytilus edulis TaxID=6550 RepID=A0A8S3RFV9_MYTED|nr:Sushi, nidogen and EGF-like domain-containing protein 1 [Mytilus edulis]